MTARALELATGDGALLRGVHFEGGGHWLVCVHGLGGDLDRWWALEALLDSERLSALALDRRGHGGSEGRRDAGLERQDIELAVREARARGADCVTVVAERDAAPLALAVDEGDGRPDALVLLSPGPVDAEAAKRLRGASLCKLILVGSAVPDFDRSALDLSRASIGWSMVVNFPTDQQGAELLDGEWAEHAREQIAWFAAETRWQVSGVGVDSR
jgi:pimeloyl-ACP methyl ester carboxylesterase